MNRPTHAPPRPTTPRRATAPILLAAAVFLAAGARGTAAQDGGQIQVRWEPERPAQGSFVFVIVGGAGIVDAGASVTVRGTLAGQPIHFDLDRNGARRGLAAIPVNAQETIPLTIEVGAGRDTLNRFLRIPVLPGEFDSERLSVDPRFTSAPDSALAERIRREGARSRAVSERTHGTPRMWSGEWVRPRPGRITSRFGTGRVFNGQLQSRHMGVDLDGGRGDPIRAANRGVVALVGDFYYAGNVVYLDHGAGLVTIYMHMSQVDVTEGEIVEAGQVIGLVGATGRVTGPHVHWVGRYGRVSVDPFTLFDLDATAFGATVADGPDARRR